MRNIMTIDSLNFFTVPEMNQIVILIVLEHGFVIGGMVLGGPHGKRYQGLHMRI